ncbi:MAG: ATP-binding protein [Anaerolineae bacterium]|nr:AAA family ATPase [Candidatus Roseilinea sp.]MDW8450388.1 ATP-binding protein [Anaerolineae bacterium]
MAVTYLTAERVRRLCDPNSFSFETTAELSYTDDIFGQPRAVRAIDFGVSMTAPGYNLFVVGPEGTGRATAIRRYLERTAPKAAQPSDWVYVHNFAEPRKPIALRLRAGQATRLRDLMEDAVAQVIQKLPLAFETDEYDDAAGAIAAQLQRIQSEELAQVQSQALQAGFTLTRTASGLAIVPDSGHPSAEVQAHLNDALSNALRRIYSAEREARAALANLDAQIARSITGPLMEDIASRLPELADEAHRAAVEAYLRAAGDDLIANVALFKPANRGGAETTPAAFQAFLNRYRVNVLVNNCDTCGAPVYVEDYPTYFNLIGRLDRALTIANDPALANVVNHMMLRPGALHRANGGYLIVRARDVFRLDDAWSALKRCLLRGSVTIEEPNAQTQLITTPTLEPQPIPLNVKVIMLGNSTDYWKASYDEDLGALFKVKAEFSAHMPRTPENELAYARFLRSRMQDEDLMPFDRTGVAAIVEHGSRYVEDQRKLTTRFSEIADVAREAAFWAKRAGRAAVSAEDVRTALRERRQRLNRYEEDRAEHLLRGSYFVQTAGAAVGQINALSVFDMGEYEFALPSRVTARSYLTRSGISDIDRNVNFTDATHNKGIAIVDSYLSSLYSVERSLTLSANVTFEQSYSSHEGDSASCALLVAMLSAVTGLPIPQHYAVTGTLDQFGFVRPIGGTNAKVEGFFDVCKARGLDGTHGVIIPAANVEDLMLREDVVEAVRDGLFKVIAVEHVDDLIELMFGMPAGVRGADGRFPEGTLHARVEAILREMDEKLDNRRKGDKDPSPESSKSRDSEPEMPPPLPEPPADPVSPSS